jgi:hypothetical protein
MTDLTNPLSQEHLLLYRRHDAHPASGPVLRFASFLNSFGITELMFII